MRRVYAFVLAFVIGGCSGGSTAPDLRPAGLDGTYTLQTINGQTLPFHVVPSEGLPYDVVGGQLKLSHNSYHFASCDCDPGNQVGGSSVYNPATYSDGQPISNPTTTRGGDLGWTVANGEISGNILIGWNAFPFTGTVHGDSVLIHESEDVAEWAVGAGHGGAGDYLYVRQQ